MGKKHKHIVKILFFDMLTLEFGPVGVFFITYYISSFSTAALALALSTVVSLVLSKTVNKRVPWFAIFSGVITIATSVVTYVYTAPSVLIIKDSVYYFLFAALLATSIHKKKYLLEKFFGHIFAMKPIGWKVLQRRWLFFFLFSGVLNEIVRMQLSIEQWVLYKQFLLIVFVVFGTTQFTVSAKYRTDEGDRLGLRK